MNNLLDKSIFSQLSTNLKSLRHEHNWSQRILADRMGISIPAYSKIETGVTDINLSRLEQIANIYCVGLARLLTTNGEVETLPPALSILQKRLSDRQREISDLQSKVIKLYEELQNKDVP
ncbi:helix-turn-helix domain-containing protein [Mucilaginibacter lappiensis]|uniref:Transcriptional regulator with XRE-family HTH domain n=1 Tax=Mucilaginibacter lappiensis TaxID=354630 RepID=A0A841JMC8_9SPHI|nr:helix-turn-helix transcriptional regulator [Mucilaginibacter lappiensis]MBB6130746.1 transcriptional regulator with XRE-family HTH domain [Mucilaginibacter lappiensis]